MAVAVAVLVAVGVAVAVAVGVAVGVLVGVGVGGAVRMDGTSQKAFALFALLLAFTLKTKRTVWPFRKDRSWLIRVILRS